MDKGIIEETKSGVPDKMKTVKEWIQSDKFRDWIDARVKRLKANGLFDKIHTFKLVITKEMMGDMTKEEVETLFNNVLKEEGLKWKGEIEIIEW